VFLHDEGDRMSGCSTRRLFRRRGRMVLTSGTQGLRFVSAVVVALVVAGIVPTIHHDCLLRNGRLLAGAGINGDHGSREPLSDPLCLGNDRGAHRRDRQ